VKKVAIILFAVILIFSVVLTGCNAYKTKPNETYHFEEVESFAKVYNLYYKNKLPQGIINILIDPVNPKRIYVATNASGLFKSEDSGTNWVKLDLPKHVYHDYILKINQKGLLYVIDYDNILYISSDCGKTWEKELKILLSSEIESVKFGTADTVYISNGRMILKSTDRGKHFYSLKLPGVFYAVNAFYFNINPYNRDEIYIATGTILYKSQDGGKIWKEINSISQFSDYGGIKQIIFVRENDKENTIFVFAGNSYPKGQNALLKSEDDGKKWKVVNKNIDIEGVIYKNPYKNNAFFILGNGLYAMKGDGTTYKYLGVYGSTCIAFDKIDPNRIFVGTSFGKLLVSKKGAGNIKIIDGNISAVTSIALSKNYVYVAKNGIYRSRDLTHWAKLSDKGNVVLVSHDDKLIIRGDNYGSSGIFVYESALKKWEKISSEKVYSMATDSTFSNIYIGTDNGIYRYLPDKNTLSHIAFEQSVVVLFVDASHSDVIYTALGNFSTGHAIYRSTDNGKTWQPCDENILGVKDKASNLIDLEQSRSIFAKGNDIYVSAFPSFYGQQNVYIGYNLLKGGLFVSKNFGKAWAYVKSLLPDEKFPVININNVWEYDGKVFVSTESYQSGSKIAYSSDLENWQYLKLDPASPIVRSVYCDELSGILYVGTAGGIYSIKIEGGSSGN
jgi:photosystem II stability/assembly factor-like uncharacterized protein